MVNAWTSKKPIDYWRAFTPKDIPLETDKPILYYEWNNLDNYYLPHKGLKIEIESAAGNKKINQVLAPELYNEIKINSLQIQGIGKIENHLSLHQTFTFVQRITGAWVNNEKLFLK